MPKQNLSLMVVLRPARGRLKDLGPISTKNVAEAAPAPGALKQAQAFFAARKCKVHPGVANSFSVEAGADVLGKLFDETELESLEATGGELSLAKLPRDIQALLEAVAFSKPPDFGPKNFL